MPKKEKIDGEQGFFRRVPKAEKVVKKPVKRMRMQKSRNKVTVDKNSKANSSQLDFPTDIGGVTTKLRAALINAGTRVGKDPKKLALIKETLKLGLEHIEARYEENKENAGVRLRSRTERLMEDAEETITESTETPTAGANGETDTVSEPAEGDVTPEVKEVAEPKVKAAPKKKAPAKKAKKKAGK